MFKLHVSQNSRFSRTKCVILWLKNVLLTVSFTGSPSVLDRHRHHLRPHALLWTHFMTQKVTAGSQPAVTSDYPPPSLHLQISSLTSIETKPPYLHAKHTLWTPFCTHLISNMSHDVKSALNYGRPVLPLQCVYFGITTHPRPYIRLWTEVVFVVNLSFVNCIACSAWSFIACVAVGVGHSYLCL